MPSDEILKDITPLPCPFCGSAPVWKRKDMTYGSGASGMEPPMRALGCDNEKCVVKSTTKWRDTQEHRGNAVGYVNVNYDEDAIADWNTRAALEPARKEKA